MALKIKISEVQKQVVLAMGGKPIQEDIYVRPTFQPIWKGYDIDIWFRFFFDTQKEDAFASLQLFVIDGHEVINENNEPILVQSKRPLGEKQPYRWQTIQPLTGEIYNQANYMYEQIKDIPQVAQIVSIIGNTAVLTNIGIHLMSKKILEEIFGENTVEIDLFLQ
jgi:hypothetical protein